MFLVLSTVYVELASLRARSCAHMAHIDTLYDGFDARGLQYGPVYRTLAQGWSSATEATARLLLRSVSEGTAVHHADLDDAQCAGALMSSSNGNGETRLPFAVDEAVLQGAPGALWAVCGRAT